MSEKITDLILEKFVNEEIMTKSELDRKLDDVMTRHLSAFEAKLNIRFDQIDKKFELIDRRFELIDSKFDHVELRLTGIENRNRWLIGILTTATISIIFGVVSFLIKTH
ncbi:MAG: hypothetical protein QG673_330 [Pseudomonadota bacterium]|nr:hypothetical protein [Pseudomonadota bacterium]